MNGVASALKQIPAVVALRRNKLYRHGVRLLQLWRYPEYRASDRETDAEFEAFARDRGGAALSIDVFPEGGPRKLALFVRNISLRYAPVEALVMKAFQMAGFETVVLSKREFEFLRYEWLIGNQTGYVLDDFGIDSDDEWIEQQWPRLRGLSDWLDLKYDGVNVGRFVLATSLRWFKVGELDFEDPEIRLHLRRMLGTSVRHARSAGRLLTRLKPDCVVFLDRGYSGQGEIADQALNRGIETFTWNLGYKPNRLVFKRYHDRNRREHPLAPSSDTWARMTSMPWKKEYGDTIRRELFDCYESQDWFSVVGTQFGKTIQSRDNTLSQLGLSAEQKIAVIFPHILWDGSFFFGEDLFDNYAQWLIETIKAACNNDRLQWVIKVHPGHVVKAKMERLQAKAAELQLIEELFANLPPHVTLVYPDTDLSTYSLFQIADYAVTVRGTVGIEAGLFGIPTVTAGTGRYDRRGFTLDSGTRDEYLQKLATLETFPRLSPEQRELAERYAFTVFLCRPLSLSSASLTFARDDIATPLMKVNCRSREDWLAADDLKRVVAWLLDGRQEDMLQLPEAP